jgi:hypothetical protein
MRFKQAVAGGVATLAAASVPVAMDVPSAAGANSFYEDRNAAQLEYTNADGQRVHCSVTGHSALMGDEGDFQGRSETATFDGNFGDGCRASLFVEVTYVDTSGIHRFNNTEGTGTTVATWNFDIQSDYEATHTVHLLDCEPSATSECSATFTTRPK